MKGQPRVILFVCTGNSCRSVMAEGILRKEIGLKYPEIKIQSAGISAIPGLGATPQTIALMKEHGMDASRHTAKRVNERAVEEADMIFVMERLHRDLITRHFPDAAHKVHLLKAFNNQKEEAVDISIPDPIGMNDQFYQDVFSVIEKSVRRIIEAMG